MGKDSFTLRVGNATVHGYCQPRILCTVRQHANGNHVCNSNCSNSYYINSRIENTYLINIENTLNLLNQNCLYSVVAGYLGMSTEKEYQELKKLAEKAGVADVSKAYNEYYKLTQASYDALDQMEPEVCYSTTDTSA